MTEWWTWVFPFLVQYSNHYHTGTLARWRIMLAIGGLLPRWVHMHGDLLQVLEWGQGGTGFNPPFHSIKQLIDIITCFFIFEKKWRFHACTVWLGQWPPSWIQITPTCIALKTLWQTMASKQDLKSYPLPELVASWISDQQIPEVTI